jgi:hypothetical protein
VAAVLRGAAVALFFCWSSTSALADPAFSRVVEAARQSPLLPSAVIDHVEADCTAARCFAETLARRLPDLVRLEIVDHPDTDSIRWASTIPSVRAERKGDTPILKITHFGRKAAAELRAASASGGSPVDLRGNGGGDFERMLELAGLLIGTRRDAVEIDHGGRIEHRSLAGPRLPGMRVTQVMTDHRTASAALLLARLLVLHAGAELVGPPFEREPILLKRRVAVDDDRRLILPVAELRVVPPPAP